MWILLNLMMIAIIGVNWSGVMDGVSSGVVGMPWAGHNSVETVVMVGGVFNLADGTVGFHQGVFAFDDIPVASFVLGFVVTGVGVFHPVFEFVFGVSLKKKQS